MRARSGAGPCQALSTESRCAGAALAVFFGLMFGTGHPLLLRVGHVASGASIAVPGFVWRRRGQAFGCTA